MGFRVFLVLSAFVIAAVSAGTVRELRALNHLVDKLDQSVEKLAKRERQVRLVGLHSNWYKMVEELM